MRHNFPALGSGGLPFGSVRGGSKSGAASGLTCCQGRASLVPQRNSGVPMAPTGQRILFVGATGHIGSFIAKEAAAKGYRVTALVSERSLGDPGKKAVLEELKAAGVELTKGSLDAPQSTLVELAKKADVVRSFSAEMRV